MHNIIVNQAGILSIFLINYDILLPIKQLTTYLKKQRVARNNTIVYIKGPPNASLVAPDLEIAPTN